MLSPWKRVHHMPEYRAYILDRDSKIQSYEPIVCVDDETAISAAKRLVDGHDVELWQGTRKVTTLSRKSE